LSFVRLPCAAKSGAGIGLNLRSATRENVAKAARMLLRDKTFKTAALNLAVKIRSERSEEAAVSILANRIIARSAM
jgi:UDP:flavonoid glycosyltransferase YjiC (YdhE family)